MTRREELAERLEEIASGGVLPDVSGEPWAQDLLAAGAVLREHGHAVRSDLMVTAAVASELARDNAGAGHPVVAAEWGKCARNALEALHLAPPDDGEDPRAELTPQDRATLERGGEILEQLNMAGDFLEQMHGEFRSAQSTVADRWASRIAATMEELTYYRPPAGGGQ